MELAGKDFLSVVIPWRIIANSADAYAVANELAARPIAREKRTSISSALLAAASLITNNKIESLRQQDNQIAEDIELLRRTLEA